MVFKKQAILKDHGHRAKCLQKNRVARNTRNIHVKQQSSSTYCLKVICKVKVFYMHLCHTPRSRSQGKNCWYPRKCLVTKKTHYKYQSSSTNCSKVEVKVFKKCVKLQGQGCSVKTVGIHGKVLSQIIFM